MPLSAEGHGLHLLPFQIDAECGSCQRSHRGYHNAVDALWRTILYLALCPSPFIQCAVHCSPPVAEQQSCEELGVCERS